MATFMSLLGLGRDSIETNKQLLNHSIRLHLDGMSGLLHRFVSGEGEANQLIEFIVLMCQHVNEHCVVANPDKGKTEFATCRQGDVQKVR